jgi:putative (di)nucleoside polyphosphate hydrolase
VGEVLGDLSLTQKVFSGGEFSPSILAFGGVKDAGICPSVLREETGILPEDFRVLDACRDWLVYELPEAYRNDKVGRGQAQKWFLCRFLGEPNSIKPDGVEFVSYEWVDRTKLLDRAAPFRRAIYERLVAEFTSYFGRK